jgi:uncharacterized protein (TIGR02246 family)
MERIRNVIAAVNEKLMAAIQAADTAGIVALYTEDARLLPPNGPMIEGTEAILAFWQEALRLGIRRADLEIVDVEARDDLAYEVGHFMLTIEAQGGERVTSKGKYVVVWKNEELSWKRHASIWNANA